VCGPVRGDGVADRVELYAERVGDRAPRQRVLTEHRANPGERTDNGCQIDVAAASTAAGVRDRDCYIAKLVREDVHQASELRAGYGAGRAARLPDELRYPIGEYGEVLRDASEAIGELVALTV